MTVATLLSNSRTSLLLIRFVLMAAVAVLMVGSLLPSQYLPISSWQDKFEHFAAYAIVSGLAMLAFRSGRRRKHCFLLLIVLGMTLEVGQIFVPGRTFELLDMAANGGGAGLAYAAARIWYGRSPSNEATQTQPAVVEKESAGGWHEASELREDFLSISS